MQAEAQFNAIPDYVLAAHGDAAACVRLSALSRTRVLAGDDDGLFGSMEGATLARLAAIRGDILAAVLMGQHLITVGQIYGEAGDDDMAAEAGAEALAILELCDGNTPPNWEREAWTDHVLGIVKVVSDQTSPAFMARCKEYRTLWAQFLSPVPIGAASE